MKESTLTNKRILVAEDNMINQMLVRHALGKLGAIACITSDGVEAIEMLKQNEYDVVLMDIQMPRMDGYEATKYIRNTLKSNIPVIAMTAFALMGEDEICANTGMNGYVSKPFTMESLCAEIDKVMKAPLMHAANPAILSNEYVTVDISMLYEIAGNDQSYIETMIETFLENMPATIKKMEFYFEIRDLDNLYKSAQYTKSSLSVVKINNLFDEVAKIELLAKNKTNISGIGAMIKEIKTTFEIAEEILLERFERIEKTMVA